MNGINRSSDAQPDTIVWLDGARRDPADAHLHWSDHGITVGDGVFETLKLVDGVPFALRRHLDRLERSASGLGLRAPDDRVLRSAVDEVCDAWGTRPGRLRITVTGGPGPMGSERGDAGPTLLIAAADVATALAAPSATVALVPWTRNERGALAGLKTTSYGENVVALARARELGAAEALVANTVGHLCEGTGSNVFVVVDDRLATPPLSSGCLAGITRELLLEALAAAGVPAIVDDLSFDVMRSCDAAALTSSTRDVQPIGEVVDVDGTRRVLDADHSLLRDAQRVWAEAFGPGRPLDP